MGAGLKNKKETYKKRIGNEKTGNEEANKKTNKIIEIAIQTISIFSAISLFAYINPQFRNQADLYLDKIKFYDINLKNIILLVLFIPGISLIFSFIFGLFDTTKKVGEIITVGGVAKWKAIDQSVSGYDNSKVAALERNETQKIIITDMISARRI